MLYAVWHGTQLPGLCKGRSDWCHVGAQEGRTYCGRVRGAPSPRGKCPQISGRTVGPCWSWPNPWGLPCVCIPWRVSAGSPMTSRSSLRRKYAASHNTRHHACICHHHHIRGGRGVIRVSRCSFGSSCFPESQVHIEARASVRAVALGFARDRAATGSTARCVHNASGWPWEPDVSNGGGVWSGRSDRPTSGHP